MRISAMASAAIILHFLPNHAEAATLQVTSGYIGVPVYNATSLEQSFTWTGVMVDGLDTWETMFVADCVLDYATTPDSLSCQATVVIGQDSHGVTITATDGGSLEWDTGQSSMPDYQVTTHEQHVQKFLLYALAGLTPVFGDYYWVDGKLVHIDDIVLEGMPNQPGSLP